jgi:DNA gyrase subunit A
MKSSAFATPLPDVVKDYFGIYATYVIKNRAIPDIRDGLKPVHRRLIYASWEMGAKAPNKMVKSAKIVGHCMGSYHPHGDSAIYETMVRLTQEFNMRIPLFDGQGNFGSIDGDAAAAHRYTEARLNLIATEMFCQNLNDEIVPFVENYDGSTKEPDVLPAELPHLLLNYDHGIAVGIHSNIMSCAPNEIIDCLISEIEDGLVTSHDKFAPKQFKGPDLATNGIMEFSKDQANSLWLTGDSKWAIRGEAKKETDERSGQQRIVVVSLPYQQKKEVWLSETAKLATEKDDNGKKFIEGITDLRDESNKDGIRIVFDLKAGTDPEVVLNQIYSRTKLQKNINTDMVAIVDGKPRHIGVRETLLYWLNYRRECVRKILNKEKREKEERAEIIDGLVTVHANIDEVIKVIRNSDDSKDALIKKFKFTERQATSVVSMRLGSLRKLDEDALKIERAELQERIDEIISILKDPKKLDNIIKERLEWWKDKLDSRRTCIVKEFGEITTKDTIAEQDVVVAINSRDEVKVTSIHDYRKSKRGAGGVKSTADIEDADSIPRLLTQVTTHDMLYAFTNKSRVFEKPCHELPITKRTSKAAMPVSELFSDLEEGEKIVDIIAMNITEMDENESIIMVRSNGNVKRMSCKGLVKKRGRLHGDECCRTDLDDSTLIRVTLAPKDSDLLIFTKKGLCRRIQVETLRMVPSRKSGAPGCMKLKDDDAVIGIASVKPGDSIATVSANGYGARFNESVLIFKKGRTGGGVRLANTDAKSGDLVFGDSFENENSELFLNTSGGKSLRCSVSDIREMGRGARGVRVQKVKEGESIVAVTKVNEI